MAKLKLVNTQKTEKVEKETVDISKIKNPVVKRILSIISYDELVEKFKAIWVSVSDWLEKALNSKKNIIYLLSTSPWELYLELNQSQKSDKDICLAALRRSPDVFINIPEEKFKYAYDFWQEAIMSFIRNWRNIIEINSFLDKNFILKKWIYKKLQEFLEKALKDTGEIILDDLSKWLLFIKSKNKSLYDFLISSKIISWAWKKLWLWAKFQKDFSKAVIVSDKVTWKKDDELIIVKREIFWEITWIDISKLSEDELFLIDTIINLCVLKDSQKSIKEQEKQNNRLEDNNDLDDLDKDEPIIDPEIKLNFCLPNCSYYETWYDSYNISLYWYKTVNLSEEELLRFTSLWLRNFVKFYSMLWEIWLSFLWDKNKSSFINILNNVIWFNYPDSAWVTEDRSLRVLNLIAKSIWIIWQVWDQYIKEYSDLESAKKEFMYIKNTRNIAWEQFPLESWLFWTPVVELALKKRWYISEKWELSFTKFMYGVKNDENSWNLEDEEPEQTNVIKWDFWWRVDETMKEEKYYKDNSDDDDIKDLKLAA